MISATVLALILLAIFILAYKILKIIGDIALIATLSAIFYYVLYKLGMSLNLSVAEILFFSLCGVILYITYSLIFSAIRMVKVPFKNIKKIKPKVRKKRKKRSEREIVLEESRK